LEGEATTEVTFQDAKLTSQNAATQIELLQKQIADNHIKSPISGQVVSKNKEGGEFVALGTVLGHVVDVSRLKVDVLVGESDVYTLKMNDKVNVTSDIFPGKTITGNIYFISNQGDAAHNYKVEILLNNTSEALKAGTFVNVDFSRQSAQKLMTISRNTLVDGINNPQVYVVENGIAVLKKITLGRELQGRYEVLGGLNAGEQVITGGQINLANGTKVAVSK
jgi:RND family efflux transporter MFP subunit